jgi:EAL domain-containing protein (putative c-di-GMP-specific phosphodiesterase class I)
MGPEDTVVRYGGAEFVIVAPTLANQSTAERLAHRVIESIERPFEFGEDRIRISASVGVALTDDTQDDPEDVIRDAEMAMYAAKARGGNGVVAVFDDSVPDRITSSTAEKRLCQALEEEQFRLVYQPIVSLQTQRMVKVEALIRWDDPDRGLISPGEFIPALEETGLIVPVGTWVLEEACRQARIWQQRHTHQAPLTVALNVSARQLGQFDFVDVLHRTLERTGVDPSLICLEITEGVLMADVDAAWTMLRQAKSLGVYLALDDFGTGFSSLSFLRQFSLDIVKIDKSFVDGLGGSREDTTIIEHVIAMARGLGMVTVAEGVETADQIRYLRSLDCHMAQGFFYSRPQTCDVIDRIMGQATGSGAASQPDRQVPAAQPGSTDPGSVADRSAEAVRATEALGPADIR